MSYRDFKSSLKGTINANRMSCSCFNLLGILEQLGISNAVYTHQDIIRDYIDKYAQQKYIAHLEIFEDDGVNKT